ncbi:MAG: cutinase family protein, partial [Mycobacterium sp.]|nr:cutinase family protein [Mycobacterium sp.]MBV9721084.1 cutinase family protein [Mycobacterium sp.]
GWWLSATFLVVPVLHVASAETCPDVEVVFARGTGEDSGVGPTGQAFVDSLGPLLVGRSMGVCPVDYATSDPAVSASATLASRTARSGEAARASG